MSTHAAQPAVGARLRWVRARRHAPVERRAWRADDVPAGPVRFHPSVRTAAQLMAERAGEAAGDGA